MFTLPVDAEIELGLRADEDAHVFFTLVDENRSYLRTWFSWVDTTQSVTDTLSYLQMCRKEFETKTLVDLGIRYRGEWVGGVSLHAINKESQKAEIGYWIAESSQGNGVVTRSMQALINYGFNVLGLNRLVILCDTTNEPSQKVAKGLGFAHEGVLRQNERVNGCFVDNHIYSLLRSEWSA